MPRHAAILLPGVIMPPDLAYAGLIRALGAQTDARAKPLQVYASDEPPPDYDLDTEVTGLLTFADDAGFERFHLVGYSGGGAVSLAAAADPIASERLLSLALLEPAWAGNAARSAGERAARAAVDEAFAAGDMGKAMSVFARVQLAPGVDPPAPPPGPPPEWMASRPAGIRAITAAFDAAELDLDALRRFERPVYLAYGGRSNADYFERMAYRLAALFPDATVERYDERHHFDPPHRAEPERLAGALRELMDRALG